MLGYWIDFLWESWTDAEDCHWTCFDLSVASIVDKIGSDAKSRLSYFLLDRQHFLLSVCFEHNFGSSDSLPIIETGLRALLVSCFFLYLNVSSDDCMSNLCAYLSLPHFEFTIDDKEHFASGKRIDEHFCNFRFVLAFFFSGEVGW